VGPPGKRKGGGGKRGEESHQIFLTYRRHGKIRKTLCRRAKKKGKEKGRRIPSQISALRGKRWSLDLRARRRKKKKKRKERRDAVPHFSFLSSSSAKIVRSDPAVPRKGGGKGARIRPSSIISRAYSPCYRMKWMGERGKEKKKGGGKGKEMSTLRLSSVSFRYRSRRMNLAHSRKGGKKKKKKGKEHPSLRGARLNYQSLLPHLNPGQGEKRAWRFSFSRKGS